MASRQWMIGFALGLAAIGAAWTTGRGGPAPVAASPPTLAAWSWAVERDPPDIVFAEPGQFAAQLHRLANDLLWLDLDGLEGTDAAWELAASWRRKVGDDAVLECWVTGGDDFHRLEAAGKLVVDACSRVVVVEGLA